MLSCTSRNTQDPTMRDERLGPLQVAALLVSASYGIGFLFGSGELAVSYGMAGCLYPWLTAMGMLLLALLASRIWQLGMPLWDVFGRSYGPAVKRSVALLSMIWMTGVLAAQMQGASTTLSLAGVSRPLSLPIVLALIVVAAHLRLGLASKVFSLCLLASSVVLLVAVIDLHGIDTYLHAVPRFAADLPQVGHANIATMTIAVVFLVLTGADYQQFIIAASARADARLGCALAAVVLVIVGALPAAAVLAAMNAGLITHAAGAKEAIPLILAHMSERIGHGAGAAMLLTLLAAALGSGAAIVRAMTDAVLAFLAAPNKRPRLHVSIAIVVLGGVVATRGQAIVETMVDLNIVYIASIAPLFAYQLLKIDVSAVAAQRSLLAGFAVSSALYAAKWMGLVSGHIELTYLSAGILASVFALELTRVRSPRSAS
jgi:SSS family solute:Na+ symporter